MILVIVLTLLLIALGCAENLYHKRNRDSIRIRILVNGTRGKTSTALLISAALRENGVRTITKTTGSEALIILSDGTIKEQKRKHGARITELIPFMALARKEKAEAVVVECMALQSENQKMFASKLLCPTHVVITNAYHDHLSEMGDDINSVIWTLLESVPTNAKLFSIDERFSDTPASFYLVPLKHYSLEGNIPLYDEDVSLAAALIGSLGYSEESVIRAALSVSGDVGLVKDIRGRNGAMFVPEFSKNDMESMEKAIDCYDSDTLSLIFSNRGDREYRVLYLRDILKTRRVKRVYIIGDYKNKVARYIYRKCDVEATCVDVTSLFRIINEAGEENIFLALGNIKGDGEALISLFISGEDRCFMRQ